MTKKKKTFEGNYSSLELNQYRLREIVAHLKAGELSLGDSQFLIAALNQIGAGEDANEVLGVKAKRGERKTSAEASKTFPRSSAMGWIASAIAPINDGGLGMKLPDAIERAAELFPLTEETLKNYWDHYPELHKRGFPRPISTLPDRRPKSE